MGASKSSRYGHLFTLLVNTGLRRGEALALQWSDIDLDGKLLRVRGTLARVDGKLITTSPTTARSKRSIPVSETTEQVLKDLRRRQLEERLKAGSQWHQTGDVSTTQDGMPCTPVALFGRSSPVNVSGCCQGCCQTQIRSVLSEEKTPLTCMFPVGMTGFEPAAP